MHLIQLTVDLPAAATHALLAGLTHGGLRDEGLVVKTALTEALGGGVVRPWRLERAHGPLATVLGYSDLDRAELGRRLALGLPSAQAAVRDVRAVPVEPPPAGITLGFIARLAPTVHVTAGRAGIRPGERDAFLLAVDRARLAGEEERLDREPVYRGYLAERLAGAELLDARLRGLRIAKLVRKAGGGFARRGMPIADMQGTLRVVDPVRLIETLRAGVGRQRAFGCGMVRLMPPPPRAEVPP